MKIFCYYAIIIGQILQLQSSLANTADTITTTTTPSIAFGLPTAHRLPPAVVDVQARKTNSFARHHNHHHHQPQQQQQRCISESILKTQRRKAATQLMGVFGLGGGEVAVILVAIVILVGPQKIAGDLGKNAGGIVSEFKDVPEEFRKGLDEGEVEARSRVAKQMDQPTSPPHED
eukprot:CAMPEP_0198264144 /NCGR_PEP_ID=MMETSP1447-20131203/14912_1 /TAXON_ID=420782 /ORGANISM="Chaetoceros dichaeta, Strain CCMP1751" /LENGTH=174 /DNA_ID=CAMNT_0043952997 /DNA_START=14 /DNA_END=538 /DNA_ORIENTATION=-